MFSLQHAVGGGGGSSGHGVGINILGSNSSGGAGGGIGGSGSASGGNGSNSGDCDGYDFTKNENAARWRGLFTPSLKKVLEQLHPQLSAKDDALLYVETLCLRLLAMLCAKPLPHSVQDVEEKVNKSFPKPIDQWALNEAKEIINSKKRKSVVLPTDRVHTLLQKDVLQYKIDSSVSLFLVAVLEYISADILKLAGNYVNEIEHCEITKEDIEVVMNADRVLMDMFKQSGDIRSCVLPSPLSTLPATQRASTNYEEVVKELIHDEKQYQRDLHMIIRVFREELVKIVRDPKELDAIFSNIMDIYEVTATLLGSLEDVIEMSQEQSAPYVGSCFEELAEAEEFNVYIKYAQEVTSQASKDALSTLLSKPDALSLMSAGHGFRDAVKYYLPKLLLVPIWHAFIYFDYIKLLMDLSKSQDDIESFEQVQGLLSPLRGQLESLPKELMVPMSSRVRRQLAIEKTRELQLKIEHWDKEVGQNCNEFIREDSLGKLGSGKRIAERKVFLFDGLMVLCKANTKKQTPSAGTAAYDYRLKEKFFMRRVEINDRPDTDELKHSFEIAPRVQPAIILTAKNQQHKNDWMADLIMVNTKSMLDRILDSILLDIEKKHPLRMPSAEIYKFAVPDSNDNIVLEERESAGVPLIKGATLCKLVERLTYHIYADPMFVRTFLTTYRYFCTPQQLLSLLIERFNIPDPSLVYQDSNISDRDVANALNCDTDKMHKNSQREDWKRYRKEYVQPVQFRVLNVLRHWVDHHFYDFEKDPTLLEKLLHFLENVNGKSMRKWVDSVLKIVQRKNEQEKSNKKIVYAYGHDPPPIEYHLNVPDEEITLLTLHPLELARQLTLLEFELYKNVKPSELVGSPWTKKDKDLKSPNLLKIMKHTTNVTRWIEKSIIEAENYEERVAMISRAIEVMMVLLELNNFNGVLSISAAMGSASVYRLKLTFQNLPARYDAILKECRELNDGHLKKYQERLRSINPPCVPFFGRYLTNILHLEEGNPDFLPNTELINFSKRRKVSEIIGEIQQYQNQPYCLKEEPKIRHFLETLDPFKGMSDTVISDHLYHESMRIEPRGCKQLPKLPRKWPTIPLKSPGIKPRRQNNNNNSNNKMATLNSSAAHSHQAVAAAAAAAIAASTTTEHTGDQSPTTANSSSIGPHGGGGNNNPNAYSVFAIVNIPERNGTTWISGFSNAVATGASGTPVHKVSNVGTTVLTSATAPGTTNNTSNAESNGEVPHLPKKPGAHVWTNSNAANDVFSPMLPEHNAVIEPPLLPPPPINSNTWHHQHGSGGTSVMNDEHMTCNSSNPFVTANDLDAAPPLPPSPLPKVVVSPRHEPHSPFHSSSSSAAGFHHFQRSSIAAACTTTANFSPTNSSIVNSTTNNCGEISPHLSDCYYNNQNSTSQSGGAAAPVPISPHVNVPTAPNVEYRTAPPLPPRRKERTESCADLAQKRQAPDAPTLPPRDGELSPPPIPPRLNHSMGGGTLSRSYQREFMSSGGGKHSLQLPNTSSIMIRRNSAIEKRQAAATGNTVNATSASSANDSSSNTMLPTSQLCNTSGNVATAVINVLTMPPNVVTSAEDIQPPQAISPALSSSTTTSPMTPMTPISPHIPTRYQISNDNVVTTTVYQQQQQLQQPQHQHHHNHNQQQHQSRLKPISNTITGNLLHHHNHNHQQQHHHHHHHAPPPIPPLHYLSQSPQLSSSVGSIGGTIHPPIRSSPKEYYTSDGTPKLPPKPSLSANYNNPEKGTMFLYPSTNQE